ncbi:hypothetical protein, partial [Mycobacterium canetti]|uniref:hypothetical protein n=1 Tax=Mycobacterium canetti TaxID=78331 RepID=UPI00399D5E8C
TTCAYSGHKLTHGSVRRAHFFGCTPLGPVAWTGVFSATAGATAVSALAPKWLASTVGVVQPDERPDDAEDSDAGG